MARARACRVWSKPALLDRLPLQVAAEAPPKDLTD
jgi:hypothetical protein